MVRLGFAKGALVGALAATVIMCAGTALAGSGVGALFNLGKTNKVNRTSTLVNKGAGPALSLKVKAGKAPLAVNSSAKVANLNADAVDGWQEFEEQHVYAASSAPVVKTMATVPTFGVLKAEVGNGAGLRYPTFVNTSDVTVTVGIYAGQAFGYHADVPPGDSFTPNLAFHGGLQFLLRSGTHLADLELMQMWPTETEVRTVVLGQVR